VFKLEEFMKVGVSQKILILSLALTGIFATSTNSFAQANKENIKQGSQDTKGWVQFQELRRRYRGGEIGDEGMWAAITAIAGEFPTMTRPQQSAILQTQASLMSKANNPILSAVFAAQALRDAADPLDEEYRRSWVILREVSRSYPIQNIIEDIGSTIDLKGKPAPGFGGDWNYFLGNSLLKVNKSQKALEEYQKVHAGDRYYLPALFQIAMIFVDNNKKPEAIGVLKKLVSSSRGNNRDLSKTEYAGMVDHANMALGRIYYEERQFGDAIKQYRMVSRDGSEFYDSLFEQSWALFLAGFPNHALGMIYGVQSPFFKDTFNPESTMLASIIYYWMCRYDDSREELGKFIAQNQSAINSLDKYLARGASDPMSYYRLFEDAVTGVSSEALGLPREIVIMAAQQDNLLYVRDQYAAVIKEIQTLDAKGIFSGRERLDGPRGYLDRWATVLRREIGSKLYGELKVMKSDYERLYDQGQFLYVELLMSKKDQLLGKELHGAGKFSQVTEMTGIRGWGKKAQAWAGDDKQEYWSDELGYHIYRLQPMCVAKK
jgi:tetratricopeptide (TPR) repeat protein